jgi:hypothetical protein
MCASTASIACSVPAMVPLIPARDQQRALHPQTAAQPRQRRADRFRIGERCELIERGDTPRDDALVTGMIRPSAGSAGFQRRI